MKSILMLLDNEFPQDDRVEKEALSLIESGFKVTILCPRFNRISPEEQYKGISILRFSIKKNLYKKLLGLIQIFPFYKNLWILQIKKVLKHQKINIIHIHDLPLCCTIQWIKKTPGLKVVADMHENYPAMVAGQEHIKKFPNKYLIKISRWYKLEQLWLNQADLIICTASGMINRLKKLLNHEQKYVLVPNTLDIVQFKQSQTNNDLIEKKFVENFVVLSYGVISEQRGIQFVLKALALVKTKIPNIKLVVLGDGSYSKKLKTMAENLNILDLVAFEGWQQQSYLNSYMKNTDICIIPHIKSEHTDNTSPNKLFHFMYFGKPILASNCNYIQEIVEEEECGLIYHYDDHKELGEKIIELHRNKSKRIELGKNGMKSVIKKYNWPYTVQSMIKSYEAL